MTDLSDAAGALPEPSTRDKVRAKAGEIRAEAGARARTAAEEGKAKAAETLSSVSEAARNAADKLKGTKAEPFSGYVESAADSISGLASKIDSRSVDDLVDDVREMVRRSPVIAIGAAALAGFVISRFLKATTRETYSRRYSDD
jgi:ElaB/YqjD/DUF883 family membrane-anchored ribosome-binding protein